MHQEHQVLLPSDYLTPPGTNWNDAISTDNLKKGPPLSVWHASSSSSMPAATITARSESDRDRDPPEDEAALVNPIRVAPLLYATASGQQAFQQPQQGLSLFGRALLDGLLGTLTSNSTGRKISVL